MNTNAHSGVISAPNTASTIEMIEGNGIKLLPSNGIRIKTEEMVIENTVFTGFTTVAVNTAKISSRFTNLGGECPLLMVQAVQTGGNLFNKLQATQGVALLAIDTSAWQPKLSNLHHHEAPTEKLRYIKPLFLGGNTAGNFLQSLKAKVPGIRMLVIDNLEAFLPNAASNTDNVTLKKDLTALHEAAIDNGVAVVAVLDAADAKQNALRKRIRTIRKEVFTTMITVKSPTTNTIEFKVVGSFGKGKYKHQFENLNSAWCEIAHASTQAAGSDVTAGMQNP